MKIGGNSGKILTRAQVDNLRRLFPAHQDRVNNFYLRPLGLHVKKPRKCSRCFSEGHDRRACYLDDGS